MFDGIAEQRVLAMTKREKRWFDNIKKAFHDSDMSLRNGTVEDTGLQELFKAVDTAKTLRRSLRGEDTSPCDNKKRFIEFLGLEVPAFRPDGCKKELRDRATGNKQRYTLGEIVYLIRCMVHENENLNAAEAVDYHILLDWSVRDPPFFAELRDGQFVFNGFFLWNRLREVLSKFITGIQSMIDFTEKGSFSIGVHPELGSIRRERRPRTR